MLGKILHFEFPQSYYMGGDANRLNCAMKGSAVQGGNATFLSRPFGLTTSVIPVKDVLFSHGLKLFTCKHQKCREIPTCLLCIINLCELLVPSGDLH